jgi:hypothetical protein
MFGVAKTILYLALLGMSGFLVLSIFVTGLMALSIFLSAGLSYNFKALLVLNSLGSTLLIMFLSSAIFKTLPTTT